MCSTIAVADMICSNGVIMGERVFPKTDTEKQDWQKHNYSDDTLSIRTTASVYRFQSALPAAGPVTSNSTGHLYV